MNLRRSSASNVSYRQRGSYLLEALIAILIFSFGILGLIGLLGSSIRITNDARYRTEAANLASAMIADMWTMNAAQMDTQFGPSGAKLAEWQAKAAELLPSSAANPPTVDLTQPGLSPQSRTAVVTVYWKLPGEVELHQHLMTAQIGEEPVNPRLSTALHGQRGVGLMEVMVSVVIGMLLVLVIYQVYEISEGQKRTITSGSDAQQNASYGVFVLGRDISMAGNGIASTAVSLDTCAMLRPIPVLIEPGATDDHPDKITVLYGGSPSLSTAVPFRASATAELYVVAAPIAFSPNDIIVAAKPPPSPICTLSVVTAVNGLPNPNGEATLTQTRLLGSPADSYVGGDLVVNLGQAASIGRIEYTVDTVDHVLRSQNLLPDPAAAPNPSPIINDVVALKAQYGVNVNPDCKGNAELEWKSPKDAGWSPADVQGMPVACVGGNPSLRRIQAIRIAIVTRSSQLEKEVVTPRLPAAMPQGKLGLFCDPAPDCAVIMDMTRIDLAHAADYGQYRYKVLETAIPLRNALWNGQ